MPRSGHLDRMFHGTNLAIQVGYRLGGIRPQTSLSQQAIEIQVDYRLGDPGTDSRAVWFLGDGPTADLPALPTRGPRHRGRRGDRAGRDVRHRPADGRAREPADAPQPARPHRRLPPVVGHLGGLRRGRHRPAVCPLRPRSRRADERAGEGRTACPWDGRVRHGQRPAAVERARLGQLRQGDRGRAGGGSSGVPDRPERGDASPWCATARPAEWARWLRAGPGVRPDPRRRGPRRCGVGLGRRGRRDHDRVRGRRVRDDPHLPQVAVRGCAPRPRGHPREVARTGARREPRRGRRVDAPGRAWADRARGRWAVGGGDPRPRLRRHRVASRPTLEPGTRTCTVT